MIISFNNVKLASENEGYYFLHPFDGYLTIQGTSSLGLEIFNQIQDFDNILNLDLEGLQSSEYIINVKGNGINYSTKVIKKWETL